MKLFSRRSAAVLVFTALLIVIVNAALWIFYNRTEKKFDEQLSRRLSSIAQLGSSIFTPKLVSAMLGGQLWAYDQALDMMDHIKESDSLSEVFVLYPDRKYLATTSLYIGVDSLYYLGALNDATIDSAFSMGGSGLFAGPISRPSVTAGYKVGDLLLKSAYVPLVDTSGVIKAVLGVEADVDYTDDLNELRQSLYLASGISIGIGLLLGTIFFFLQRRMEASEKSLILNQSQANLGRMVAVVSHEIKNPLMIIRASAERIKNKLGSDEAEYIIDETDRLNRIVTGYLDFASGRYALKSEKVDTGTLVSRISEKFAPRLAQEGVKLRTVGNLADGFIEADPAAIRQIIINLILNAAEEVAEKNDATVEIGLASDNKKVKITVGDNGGGIDRKTMKEIFEPFYTTKTTGSGLGLYLSRKLTEQMNGSIEITSGKGNGTTVTLTFPRIKDGE